MEASLRLPADVGGSDWGQLPRRDPGAAPGPGPDEEPHHPALEALDGDAHPRQLPGPAPELCLHLSPPGRLCHLTTSDPDPYASSLPSHSQHFQTLQPSTLPLTGPTSSVRSHSTYSILYTLILNILQSYKIMHYASYLENRLCLCTFCFVLVGGFHPLVHLLA